MHALRQQYLASSDCLSWLSPLHLSPIRWSSATLCPRRLRSHGVKVLGYPESQSNGGRSCLCSFVSKVDVDNNRNLFLTVLLVMCSFSHLKSHPKSRVITFSRFIPNNHLKHLRSVFVISMLMFGLPCQKSSVDLIVGICHRYSLVLLTHSSLIEKLVQNPLCRLLKDVSNIVAPLIDVVRP